MSFSGNTPKFTSVETDSIEINGDVISEIITSSEDLATLATDEKLASSLSVKNYVDSQTSLPDATSSIKGVLKLTGDLGGTADSPTVPGLSGKQDSLGFTPENVSNKSTLTSLGTSDTLYPTQNAVKQYVDGAILGIPSGGEANTASNVGIGDAEVFKQKSGVDLEFRTLVAGTNVTLTEGTDTITIASTGGGGGSALEIKDESTILTSTATSISFVGSGVSATAVGDVVTVNIPVFTPSSQAISALNIDWSLADLFYKDISANSTFTFSNVTANKNISVFIHNTGVSQISVTFPTGIYKADTFLFIDPGEAAIYSFMNINSRTYLTSASNLTNL